MGASSNNYGKNQNFIQSLESDLSAIESLLPELLQNETAEDKDILEKFSSECSELKKLLGKQQRPKP